MLCSPCSAMYAVMCCPDRSPCSLAPCPDSVIWLAGDQKGAGRGSRRVWLWAVSSRSTHASTVTRGVMCDAVMMCGCSDAVCNDVWRPFSSCGRARTVEGRGPVNAFLGNMGVQ